MTTQRDPRDLLADETWLRLDPRAGELSAVERRRVRIACVALVILLTVFFGIWRSGVLWPRLATGGSGGFDVDRAASTFSVLLEVDNRGSEPLRVLAVGRSGPGLRLLGVDDVPTDLPSSTGVAVTLRYAVTDCAAVPRGAWPVPVVVERRWGDLTVHLDGPTISGQGGEDGSMVSSGSDAGELGVPWQRWLAAQVCPPGR